MSLHLRCIAQQKSSFASLAKPLFCRYPLPLQQVLEIILHFDEDTNSQTQTALSRKEVAEILSRFLQDIFSTFESDMKLCVNALSEDRVRLNPDPQRPRSRFILFSQIVDEA